VLTATGCVGYFSALAWYSYRGPSGAASSLPLNPSYFTPVTILSSENTTPSTKLITLKIPPSSLPSQTTSSLTPIFSIYIKDSDIQVERPYTPLTGISQDGTLKLWIKKYEKGEVGRWIHGKKVGESIEIRGPVRNWEWKDGVWDDVVMVM
jgi:cytochrome-b5 reductase